MFRVGYCFMKCHAVTRYVPGTYVLEYVAINRYRSYMGEYCCLASVEYVTSCSLAGVENVGSRGSPRIILEHLDLLKDHCYVPGIMGHAKKRPNPHTFTPTTGV